MIYEVYCDGNLIFSSELEDRHIFNAYVNLELNKTGSFTFDIYPDHPHYGDLHKLKSEITVWRNSELLFRGRILNDEQGFYNQKQVVCEGELSFLLDSVIRPHTFTGTPLGYIMKLLKEHNSQVETWKQFQWGNVTVKDGDTTNLDNSITRSDTDYNTTWDTLAGKLVDTLGGYLWPRHEVVNGKLTTYIDYLSEADIPQQSSQPIEFGKNLIDLKKINKGEDLMTGIIPLGSKDGDNYVTIKGAKDSEGRVVCEEDYLLDEDASKLLGKIFKTVQWDDVTEPYNLWKKAKEYLKNAVKFSTSIELTAADLAGITGVDPFRLGQKIIIKDEYHGLGEIQDATDDEFIFLVKKLELDLLQPSNNRLVVGATFLTLTEASNSASTSTTKLAAKVSKIEEKLSGDLAGALTKEEAAEIYATKTDLNTLEGNISEGLGNINSALQTLIESVNKLTERIEKLEAGGIVDDDEPIPDEEINSLFGTETKEGEG